VARVERAASELMMNIDTTKTMREIALNIPGATRVFEKLGIDYCCGGNKPFEKACSEANLQIQQVIDSLESAVVEHRQRNTADLQRENWQNAPLGDLIAHIQDTHHKYVKMEISRLRPLVDKVCNVHGLRHPELAGLRTDFHAIAQELSSHMMKEEMVLFPYIERMEESLLAGDPLPPAPFGTVENPVSKMVHEHDSAGNLLRHMRQLSNGYTPPEGACTSYKTLYWAFAEFERDLHQHVHLENNILFPRAVKMERENHATVDQC
jgi:regulator of cell morphogenesis and NO signaling